MRFSLFLISLFALQSSAVADYSTRSSVLSYIDEVVSEHNFDKAELTALFVDAEKKQAIIDAISRPAEKTWRWHEYRALFLQEERVDQGVQFWLENKAALDAANARYSVAPEYIVAIIGVETRWGRVLGSYRVIDALSTLAFDYPPRAPFFRKELTQFLLLAREERKDPRTLNGSYAGAMGYGQFIPSSYRHYAVDFDEDGVRDIWTNKTDAIGSIANYFVRHGWRGDEALLVKATDLPEDVASQANTTLHLKSTVGAFRAKGVRVADDVSDDEKAALFRFENVDETEFYLGLNDFYAITRYNHSRLYARAVYDLAQAIKAKYENRVAP